MTKKTSRMSRSDQGLIAALIIKYGAKEVRRIVDKSPTRSAGRPTSKLLVNDFQVWIAVGRLLGDGMNKANAFKSVAKTLSIHSSRQIAAETVKGYYLAADKARIADPLLNERLSRSLAGLKDAFKIILTEHGSRSGVVVPLLFIRQK